MCVYGDARAIGEIAFTDRRDCCVLPGNRTSGQIQSLGSKEGNEKKKKRLASDGQRRVRESGQPRIRSQGKRRSNEGRKRTTVREKGNDDENNFVRKANARMKTSVHRLFPRPPEPREEGEDGPSS